MAAPVITYSSSPTSVMITWVEPNNGGSPITAYTIQVQHGDDNTQYSAELTYCDGSSLGIMAAKYCEIPLTTLRVSPFSLALDSTVYAKVSATNSVGAGAFSSPNTVGVSIQTEPSAPTSTLGLVSYDETRATVSIGHLLGLQAGNSAILSYEVAWDRGLNQAEWVVYTVVSSSTTEVTVHGLSSGGTYAFKYRA
jgi:hypothetical protein